MSSKILSTQEAKGWQPRANSSGKKQDASNLIGQEFRGLPNRALITLIITLCSFGLMVVFSASAPEALSSFQDSTAYLRKQAIACAIGFFLMFTLSKYDYRKLKRVAWPLTLFSLMLLAVTLVPGMSVTTMGSTRWIQVGPIQFQPSELAKVATIILMASGVSKYFWWHRQVFVRLIVILMMAGIVVKQPDLGTAIMILGTLLSMLFVSGTNTLLILGAMGVGGTLAWHHIQKTPYQMARIQSWLNPELNPQREGWNIIQAQLAIGSGGLWGQGFGHSLQKLYYLPVQHADFIFAVISEEFGLLGCLTVLALFGLFAYYGFQTALQAKTLFGRFLAIGITSQIMLQALVNIMVCTGLLPVTGITLPFLSYGGTSMVITLAMVGILLSISRDRGQVEEEDSYEVH
ncbi:MAG: putative lipid II flippase FtsW [Candidatus Obscuribacterales bacterium]|nr:putative lipid II flippase FtsW [Candidatus Obscuribacterales bacterium]